MLFKSLHIFFEIVVFSTFEIFGSLKAYFYFFDMCIKSPSSFAKGTPKGEGEGGVAQVLRHVPFWFIPLPAGGGTSAFSMVANHTTKNNKFTATHNKQITNR